MVKTHVQNCIGEPTLMTYIFTLHSEEHSGTRRQNAIVKHNLNRRDRRGGKLSVKLIGQKPKQFTL